MRIFCRTGGNDSLGYAATRLCSVWEQLVATSAARGGGGEGDREERERVAPQNAAAVLLGTRPCDPNPAPQESPRPCRSTLRPREPFFPRRHGPASAERPLFVSGGMRVRFTQHGILRVTRVVVCQQLVRFYCPFPAFTALALIPYVIDSVTSGH